MHQRNVFIFIILLIITFSIALTLHTTWKQASKEIKKFASVKRKVMAREEENEVHEDGAIIEDHNQQHEQMPSSSVAKKGKMISSSVPSPSITCKDILTNKACRDQILSPPKFSDFPEYSWPNQTQLLHESPIRFSSSFKSPIQLDDRDAEEREQQQQQQQQQDGKDNLYINSQVRDLKCKSQIPSDQHRQSSSSNRPTVRVYVPWKSFTYLTPYPLSSSCPNVDCQLTNSKEEIDKLISSKQQHHHHQTEKTKPAIDAYLVDTNGAYVNEVYDWVRNSLGFVLVAFNTENIEGRRAALRRGYGLRYLAKPWNSTWWSFFHITASYQRYSHVMVNFFHWALCRDASFVGGFEHWVLSKKKMHYHVSNNDGKKKKSSSSTSSSTALSTLSFRGKLKYKKDQEAPLLFYVRNCDFTSHRRSGFMKRLSKHIAIDSVGNCHNNRNPKTIRGCSDMKGNIRSCLIAEYRFYLAIENSISLDYVSEKVYEPLLVGTIPIYLGAPNAEDFLPAKHSVILARDFSSLKQLASYVKCIMNNQTLYEYYTSWYDRPLLPRFKQMISKPFAPICEICMKIAELKNKKYKNGGLANYFEQGDFVNSREPGVSGEVYEYGERSQAPLKECL